MSFVTTLPAALLAAAGRLEGLGSSMTAQNAAAAAPTAAVAPAAADPVSALQAALFSAYGNLYQSVSAQAAAIHQSLVGMLGTNAGSYGLTEAANKVATSGVSAQTLLPGLSSADSVVGTPIGWGQNFPAAASDLFSLGPGFATPPGAAGAPAAGLAGDIGTAPAVVAPAPAVPGGAAVLASAGGASPIGGLSVPPSWAAGAAPVATPEPATLTGTGWTGAAAHASQTTALPAGVPSVASTGRAGTGLGVPRYGAKPTVMPKPTVV